jgi:phage repressor protein C with HTH and peptisase S24 domain
MNAIARELAPPPHRVLEPGGTTIALAYGLEMIEVVGDAMAPTLRPGTQMIVDRLDTVPSPPGLFLIANAIGEQPQRCEIVPNSKPLRIRLSHDNERYQRQEVPAASVKIAGRVVGFFTRC